MEYIYMKYELHMYIFTSEVNSGAYYLFIYIYIHTHALQISTKCEDSVSEGTIGSTVASEIKSFFFKLEMAE